MSSFIEKKNIDEFLNGIDKKNKSLFVTSEEKRSVKSDNLETTNADTHIIKETPYR